MDFPFCIFLYIILPTSTVTGRTSISPNGMCLFRLLLRRLRRDFGAFIITVSKILQSTRLSIVWLYILLEKVVQVCSHGLGVWFFEVLFTTMALTLISQQLLA